MDLFDEALCFAIEKHSGQVRKMSDSPYILHPLEAAAIVGTMTSDKETLAAAVLHDTVEDAGVSLEEIAEKFGKRVSLLVMTETENKREELSPDQTWMLRKKETLIMLSHTKDMSVKMMWLGDKLSNIRSFYRLYLRQGNEMWKNFNQKDPSMQAWYYMTIADCLKELAGYDAYREYVSLVNEIFETVERGNVCEI